MYHAYIHIQCMSYTMGFGKSNFRNWNHPFSNYVCSGMCSQCWYICVDVHVNAHKHILERKTIELIRFSSHRSWKRRSSELHNLLNVMEMCPLMCRPFWMFAYVFENLVTVLCLHGYYQIKSSNNIKYCSILYY